MPRFDGTGPTGQGPMTGWGMGYCAVRVSPAAPSGGVASVAPLSGYPAFASAVGSAYGLPGLFYPRLGRGFGMGYGRGFGGRGGRGRGGRRRRLLRVPGRS